ncbi:hypothetical protein [Prosthecodimorpha staleyi]|uniref:Type II secretion system protein GspC N-terminal domain-containing protein n=1 Tax=Prosthecodimorpha staleyi TaxID=2840188 RepID=A0A947D2L1_9HYPH|nr:hypothetical protein [Prosthecodimorpha staleyi]MBT9289615.1 hypothetical protein [Prosthecodimorpha staleyi]
MSRGRHPLPALSVVVLLAAMIPAAPGWAISIETLTLDGLSATRDRPLFVPSRRPPPPPPPAVVAPPPVAVLPADPGPPAPEPVVPPTAVLTGVIVGGETRIAVFRGDDGKPLTVRQGEEIQGWTVAEIQARSITLEQNGEQLELALKPPGEAP